MGACHSKTTNSSTKQLSNASQATSIIEKKGTQIVVQEEEKEEEKKSQLKEHQQPRLLQNKEIDKKTENGAQVKNVQQLPKSSQDSKETASSKSKSKEQGKTKVSGEEKMQRLEFMQACIKNEKEEVMKMIKKYKINDLAGISGINQELKINDEKGKLVKAYNTSTWNPLLLSIGYKLLDITKLLFAQLTSMHRINCLSKPYSKDRQKSLIFDHSRRLKRECFALKLAIKNRDEEMIKFLWNDLRTLWNLGHFFVIMKSMVKAEWEIGLRMMFSSTTTKVIFMSVNTSATDFADVIDLLQIELAQFEKQKPEFTQKVLKPQFNQRPYFIYAYFLELTKQGESIEKPNPKTLNNLLKEISQEDMQLTHAQASELFEQYKENHELKFLIKDQKKRFLSQFENKDRQIEKVKQELKVKLESGKSYSIQDQEEILDVLDELDLFSFTNYSMSDGTQTNALIESLKVGLSGVLDYAFNDGFINIRSVLKRNNVFEIENEVAQMNLSYFRNHLDNLNFLKMLYYALLNFMQLSNILEIFDYALENENDKIQLHAIFDFVLNDPRFKSLFHSSMEFQKYIFINETLSLSESENLPDVLALLNQEPFAPYLSDINSGQNGEQQYTQLTVKFLQELAQKKLGIQKRALEEIKQPENNKEEKIMKLNTTERTGGSLIKIISTQEGQSPKNEISSSIFGVAENSKNKKSQFLMTANSNSPRGGAEKRVETGNFNQETVQESYSPPPHQMHLNFESNNNQLSAYQSLQVSPGGAGLKPPQPLQVNRVTGFNTQDLDQRQLTLAQQSLITLPNNGDDDLQMDLDFDQQNLGTEDLITRKLPQSFQNQKKQQKDFSQAINVNQSLRMQGYEKVHQQIVEGIRENNLLKIKSLVKKYNIKNIASLLNLDNNYQPQPLLKIQHHTESENTASGRNTQRQTQSGNQVFYDVTLWNPVLFAIYYQRVDIVQYFMQELVANFILAMRLPPFNEFTEYIIPNHHHQQPQSPTASPLYGHSQLSQQNLMQINNVVITDVSRQEGYYTSSSPRLLMQRIYNQSILRVEEDQFGLENLNGSQNNEGTYNPSDSRVECFGLELAIRNRDIQMFKYLWNDHPDRYDERHFSYILATMLQDHWDIGLGVVLRAKTSHVIFRSLAPEDKDNFLFSKIVDRITDLEFWEREASNPIKITQKQVQIVTSELSYDPYGAYAVLKFPQLFTDPLMFENTLKKVSFDEIYDFVLARKENLSHFKTFQDNYSKKYPQPNSTILTNLQNILKKAVSIHQSLSQLQNNPFTVSRQQELNPERLVTMIKQQASVQQLVTYFQKEEGDISVLERLSLMIGYEDKDYTQTFKSSVKYIPTDEILRLLITESTTADWNPLIFCIFYQKPELLDWFCKHPLVNLRACVVRPFLLEANEEVQERVMDANGLLQDNDELDEKFIQEKSELFALIMCIMLQNRELFRYLLKRCSFLLNDIHLALLTNYVFEAQWVEGMKAMYTSITVQQIFGQMNLYEKERYLKFCERSVLANKASAPNMLSDYRYLMSFEPYHAFYLPLLASAEDLQFWDHTTSSSDDIDLHSRELFIKTCLLNFDEKAMCTVMRYNGQYVSEFISIVCENSKKHENTSLGNFGSKLKRMMMQLMMNGS